MKSQKLIVTLHVSFLTMAGLLITTSWAFDIQPGEGDSYNHHQADCLPANTSGSCTECLLVARPHTKCASPQRACVAVICEDQTTSVSFKTCRWVGTGTNVCVQTAVQTQNCGAGSCYSRFCGCSTGSGSPWDCQYTAAKCTGGTAGCDPQHSAEEDTSQDFSVCT